MFSEKKVDYKKCYAFVNRHVNVEDMGIISNQEINRRHIGPHLALLQSNVYTSINSQGILLQKLLLA